jgi:hypothetical protein
MPEKSNDCKKQQQCSYLSGPPFGHRCRSNLPKAVHEPYNSREAVLKKEIPVYTVCSGAGEGNLNFVRMPIDRGENVNAQNRDGQTALWHVEGKSCRRP